ncbi:MAG TPA: zinc-dependent alcohol dehydrogenase family protein [Verrucomicrobiae bacterium]|nr:zinc-dependent alcohol dehydrogenase family protein [Verrucomicrobiae bacterium]
MNAMLLRSPRPAEESPLELTELPQPEPEPDEILLHVRACGVCHTDLHTVEGDIADHLPIVPGHQIVGVVEKTGADAKAVRVGDRLGVPWLHRTCGLCEFCRSQRENLCERAQFTGLHVNGGYAEYAVAPVAFAVPIPHEFDDAHAAPLLCAGIVGFRALRLALRREGEAPAEPSLSAARREARPPRGRLGLYGFGASAHIVVQIAVYWGCEVFVATRSVEHQRLARELGAAWVGRAEDMPNTSLDSAIIFAPAGVLVPEALRSLRKGGTLALGGIYMTPIPELKYDLLYHERVVRSVTNATRDDARQFLQLAARIPVRTEVETFPLPEANRALLALKRSEIHGAAVLMVGG